jgi:hypothetical protein
MWGSLAMKFIGVVLVLLLIASCREPDEPCDFTSLHQCHNEQGFDSLKLAKAIVGKWKWDYRLNCSAVVDGAKNTSDYGGLTIEFRDDGTFVLNRPNSTSYFQWELDSIPHDGRKVVDPNRAGAPPHESLWGVVIVCGDKLLANDSYRDGMDNFFVRE